VVNISHTREGAYTTLSLFSCGLKKPARLRKIIDKEDV